MRRRHPLAGARLTPTESRWLAAGIRNQPQQAVGLILVKVDLVSRCLLDRPAYAPQTQTPGSELLDAEPPEGLRSIRR